MLNELKNKSSRMLSALLLLALVSLPVSALDLNQARSQGLAKETSSGYLVVVKPSSEVNALVKKVNAGRKAAYQKIAKQRGTSLSAVEKLAGEKLVK